MKTKLTYEKAYAELTDILNEIEQDTIQLDMLAEKVKRAKELLEFCKNTLRKADDSMRQALED